VIYKFDSLVSALEEQENKNSVVLDNENHLDSNKEPEGSSGSVTGGRVDGNSSAGGSSENSSDGDEETAVRETLIKRESSGEAMVEETVQQNIGASLLEETAVSETVKTENVRIGQPSTTSSTGEKETLGCKITDLKMGLDPVPKPVAEEIVTKSTAVADSVKPLNLEEFNSLAELEVLGMEKLKFELKSWGLKCGGTLQERAVRLFLLKTTPLEKLPKKLLAKK